MINVENPFSGRWLSTLAGIICIAYGVWLGYVAGYWFEAGRFWSFAVAMVGSVVLAIIGVSFIWHL